MWGSSVGHTHEGESTDVRGRRELLQKSMVCPMWTGEIATRRGSIADENGTRSVSICDANDRHETASIEVIDRSFVRLIQEAPTHDVLGGVRQWWCGVLGSEAKQE